MSTDFFTAFGSGATPPPPKPAPVQSAPAPATKSPQSPSPSPAPVASPDFLKAFGSGGSPLPQPPSALGAVGDVLDAPFVAANALSRDGAGIGGSKFPFSNVGELGKVVDQVRRFGMRGLEDVNRRYGTFTPEQLADQAKNGDPFAGWLATNPKVGPVPVTAVADFISEFANPSNALLPPAVRGIGSAVGKGLKMIPGAERAGQAITHEVAPYDPLRRATPPDHVPGGPNDREAAGREFNGAKARADEEAHKRLGEIFPKDLTRAEAIEIERRSENLGPRGVVNPPRQVFNSNDEDLDKFAAAHRAGLRQLDEEQLANGQIDKRRMLLSSEYTPRYGGGHNKTYIDPNAPPGSELDEYLTHDQPPAAGVGKTHRTGTAGQGIHKTYLTHDEAEASGHLSPEYDPRDAMAAHFRQRLTNVELAKMADKFKGLGQMKHLEYRTLPDVGDPAHRDQLLGFGAGGHEAADAWAGRTATPLAHAKTAEALGLPEGTRRRAIELGGPLARAQEAQRAAGQAGMSSTKLRAARVKQDSDAIKKAASYVYGQGTRAQTRALKLSTKFMQARLSNDEAKIYKSKFNELFPGLKSGLIGRVEKQAEGRVKAEGMIPSAVTPRVFGGAAGSHMATTTQLDQFLREQGIPREQAHGMSAFIDNMNALTRVGIIANPFVHVLWNLNTQFLGAGGSLGEIAAKVWNPKWKVDPAWATRAEADGAIPHFSPQFKSIVGDMGYGKLHGATSELNPLEKVQRGATELWGLNQEVVFGTMEERYATLLYQKMVEGGMEGKQAGIAVRKALGDYANVSRAGIESSLNKALFFYPWLKTVIPFWMANLGEHPQRVMAPMQGVRTSNQALGDPNGDRQRPFSIYEGNWGGQDHYFSAPVPIRYIDDLMSLAAPQGNVAGGVTERVGAGLRVAESHANPALATGMEAMNTMLSPAEEPGGAALYTLWDKAAPPEVQAGQLATSLITKATPLPLQARQLIEFLRELPRTPNALQGIPGGVAAGTLGGTTYGRPSPGVNAALKTMRGSMVRIVGELRKAGDEDTARQVYHTYIDAMHKTEQEAGNQ